MVLGEMSTVGNILKNGAGRRQTWAMWWCKESLNYLLVRGIS